MVKRVQERYECDVCGDPATRYTLTWYKGSKHLDRCKRHDSAILELLSSQGEWTPRKKNDDIYRPKTISEIQQLRKKGK